MITNGYGAMYSYASRVPPEDRWAIAAYIRALQLSQNAKLRTCLPRTRASFRRPRNGFDTDPASLTAGADLQAAVRRRADAALAAGAVGLVAGLAGRAVLAGRGPAGVPGRGPVLDGDLARLDAGLTLSTTWSAAPGATAPPAARGRGVG